MVRPARPLATQFKGARIPPACRQRIPSVHSAEMGSDCKSRPTHTPEVPVITDLLFVHSSKDSLDEAVNRIPTLQYRYRLGHTIHKPLTVRDADMDRFINAVSHVNDVRYYMPDEIRPEMYGKEIRVIGGPFDGFQGRLLSLRGSRKKRLIVEIPGFITAAVEVPPDYIQLTK